MKKILTLTSVLALLAACEPRNVDANNSSLYGTEDGTTPVVEGTTQENIPGLKNADGTIASNPNSITLSDYSQEQQKKDREAYAAKINEIAAQREEVSSVDVPTLSETNPAKYARMTTNAVGVAIYARNGKKGRCGSYSSSYEAQRAFLAAGGPTNDTLGLDPDGDGFACKFDPTPYRSL